MNPHSPKSVFRFLLAAALCLGPALARADESYPDYVRRLILTENNPTAAKVFLSRPQAERARDVGDAALEAELFRRATELQDLAELAGGIGDARVVRLGLTKRPECAFCQSSTKFLAWVSARMTYLPEARRQVLRDAFWDWPALQEAQRQWLKAKGKDEAAWGALDLADRSRLLGAWGQELYTQIMAANPRNAAELEVQNMKAASVAGTLGNADLIHMQERLRQADMAIKGVDEVAGRVAKSANPELKKALAEARSAPDLETRLARLGAVYDGLGLRNEGLGAVAPARPGQTFDPSSRKVVAGLLANGLLAQIGGTWTGDEIRDFYAKHTLDLRVAPAPNFNWIGWHQNGVITFNERHIEEFVKSKGKTLRDLGTDPALLQQLTTQLSPLFVHEARHHVQEEWFKSQGLPWIYGQSTEQETIQFEAMYILEKSMRDPSFRKRLEADRAGSGLARESISKAERLRTNGPDFVRQSVNAWHYPELLSLEGRVWCSIDWHRTAAADIAAELKRREGLPPAERAALEAAPDFSGPIASNEDWKKAVATAGTKHLRDDLAAQNGELVQLPKTYDAARKRDEEFNAEVQRRYNSLLSEKDPAKPRPKVVVPPPK
jgi:hypothetical protein